MHACKENYENVEKMLFLSVLTKFFYDEIAVKTPIGTLKTPRARKI